MNEILIGKGERHVHLLPKYGNRHGLVAGATGTGKTVSLLVLAEGFSRLGVPVFMADVKGDVAGLAMPGVVNDKIQQRAPFPSPPPSQPSPGGRGPIGDMLWGTKQAPRTVGSQMGRQILRGIFGSMLGGSRRR